MSVSAKVYLGSDGRLHRSKHDAPRGTPAGLRVRRAVFPTFLLHVMIGVLALVPSSAVSGAFIAQGGHHPDGLRGWSDHAAGIELLVYVVRSHGTQLAIDLGFFAALALLLGVPLQMIWLACLEGEAELPPAARRGIQLVPQALLLTAALAPVLLIALLVLWGATALTSTALSGANAQLHDVGTLVAMLPGLALLVAWAGWHDLGRAALARHHSVMDALRLSWKALRRGALAYAAWRLLMIGIIVVGHFAGLLPSPTLALVLAQLLALGRTFVRARWLAGALVRIERAELALRAQLAAASPGA